MGDPAMSEGNEMVGGASAGEALLRGDCVFPWTVGCSCDQDREIRLENFLERSIAFARIDDYEAIDTLTVRQLEVGLFVAGVTKKLPSPVDIRVLGRLRSGHGSSWG